jgi:hypothetical protein
MENEVQQNVPPVQPLPQNPAPVPTPPTKWSKVLIFTVLGLIVIAGSVFIGIQIGKSQITKIQPITEIQIPTPTPLTNFNHDQKCSTDKDCPNNTFCDYSIPGGMGPNGFVSGQPYGSQQCILKCQNDNQCPNGQCQTFEIVGGDIVIPQKGCVNQNDQTLGIQINTCCSCPMKIRKSLIGTDGWMVYEKGKDYSSLRPANNCNNAVCAHCQPLE